MSICKRSSANGTEAEPRQTALHLSRRVAAPAPRSAFAMLPSRLARPGRPSDMVALVPLQPCRQASGQITRAANDLKNRHRTPANAKLKLVKSLPTAPDKVGNPAHCCSLQPGLQGEQHYIVDFRSITCMPRKTRAIPQL